MADGRFDHVFQYGGRTAWDDDATVVVVKRLKKQKGVRSAKKNEYDINESRTLLKTV